MSAAVSRNAGQRHDETPATTIKVDRPLPPHHGPVHEDVDHARAWDVASLLIVIRVLNAASMSTFFQPDEFYQGWEPAWALVFGPQSGAWLTWVREYLADIRLTTLTYHDRNGLVISAPLSIRSCWPFPCGLSLV